MSDYAYVGTELERFAAATRWKDYLREQVTPYLGRRVLEVGAGFGGTTRVLCEGLQEEWICLEPDRELAEKLDRSIVAGDLPPCCRCVVGTLEAGRTLPTCDSILYIDVLEHIEDDRAELARAAGQLDKGGSIVVLSPAHPRLFTPFDAAIGHYRRYKKATLAALTPEGLELVRLDYLDSVGLLASLGNRLVLHRAMPSVGQIAAWDRWMVPASRLLDPILGHRLGKSVLGVWRKPPR